MGLGKGQKPEMLPGFREEEPLNHHSRCCHHSSLTWCIFLPLINIVSQRERESPTAKEKVDEGPGGHSTQRRAGCQRKQPSASPNEGRRDEMLDSPNTNVQYDFHGWKSSKSWMFPSIPALKKSSTGRNENQADHRAISVQLTEILNHEFPIMFIYNCHVLR